MDINILSDQQCEQLRALLAEATNIVVCCHQNPDGDAIGSSLAWAEYLRQQGKDPRIIVPDMFPDFLQWMPGTERIMRYDKHTDAARLLLSTADLVFCLDFNTIGRLGEQMATDLRQSKAQRVLIDHHLEPEQDMTLSISHPEACSTAELVFRVIWQLGGFEQMTRKIAAPIYCGMMTDTGGFTYNSTKPEIYFIISQLLTKRINKDKIYRNVYNNYSEWRMRLMGFVLYNKLNVFAEKHASYFALSRQDLKRFHYLKGDAEGLVNLPLQVKGMKVSLSLREDTERENLIWVSIRSVDDFPCNKMAEQFFNGGGHLNAAGGRLYCTMDEAEQIVRKAFDEFCQG
ncbi:MAG: DHH family phosphoesterase [Prevotella sp.]|nr:DHH family phosphoesterase [Prevotella sp.]